MGIHIGNNNRFKNVTIAEKMNINSDQKTFSEKHPILIGIFCSFVVGILLLFHFWEDVIGFIEGLF